MNGIRSANSYKLPNNVYDSNMCLPTFLPEKNGICSLNVSSFG